MITISWAFVLLSMGDFLYALMLKVSNIPAKFQESHDFLHNLHNHVYQLSAKLKHLLA